MTACAQPPSLCPFSVSLCGPRCGLHPYDWCLVDRRCFARGAVLLEQAQPLKLLPPAATGDALLPTVTRCTVQCEPHRRMTSRLLGELPGTRFRALHLPDFESLFVL